MFQFTGRLQFTTDIDQTVRHGTIQFIAVGTPPDEDCPADLQYVLGADIEMVSQGIGSDPASNTSPSDADLGQHWAELVTLPNIFPGNLRNNWLSC